MSVFKMDMSRDKTVQDIKDQIPDMRVIMIKGIGFVCIGGSKEIDQRLAQRIGQCLVQWSKHGDFTYNPEIWDNNDNQEHQPSKADGVLSNSYQLYVPNFMTIYGDNKIKFVKTLSQATGLRASIAKELIEDDFPSTRYNIDDDMVNTLLSVQDNLNSYGIYIVRKPNAHQENLMAIAKECIDMGKPGDAMSILKSLQNTMI